MVLKAEQQRVRALLAEAVTVLCKNGLTFASELCVEGLIGITLDRDDVFLVNIKETFNSFKDGCDSNDEDDSNHSKSVPQHTEVQIKTEPRQKSLNPSTRQSYYARQHVARARKRATHSRMSNTMTSTPVHSRSAHGNHEHDHMESNISLEASTDGLGTNETKILAGQQFKAEPQDDDDEDDVMFVKEEALTRTSCMDYRGLQHQMTYHNQSSSIASDQFANSSNVDFSQPNYSASEGDSHQTYQDTSQIAEFSNLAGCSNWDMSAIGDQQQQQSSGPLQALQQLSPGRPERQNIQQSSGRRRSFQQGPETGCPRLF